MDKKNMLAKASLALPEAKETGLSSCICTDKLEQRHA